MVRKMGNEPTNKPGVFHVHISHISLFSLYLPFFIDHVISIYEHKYDSCISGAKSKATVFNQIGKTTMKLPQL